MLCGIDTRSGIIQEWSSGDKDIVCELDTTRSQVGRQTSGELSQRENHFLGIAKPGERVTQSRLWRAMRRPSLSLKQLASRMGKSLAM